MKTCNCSLSLDTLPGIGKIVCLDEADSTQNVARELAKAGTAERTLVIALSQTAGRGQPGREWDSAPGGIYMTLLLNPETGVKFLPHLSLISGEAVAETLTALYGIRTRIKKPNDVYAWHPRRRKWLKIAGILTESSSASGEAEWLLLGLGINLNNTPALDTAVSVKAITGKVVSREEFLERFFRDFWGEYSAWAYGSQAKS